MSRPPCVRALDLMACMGVELMIVLSYASDYDVYLRGYSNYLWRNDEWAARALNEFRMVVVASWSDLVSRAIFALGLIMTTTNVKELLQRLPRNENRVIESATASSLSTIKEKSWAEKLNTVVPKVSSSSTVTSLLGREPSKQKRSVKTSDRYRGTKLRTRGAQLLLRVVHLLFGAWGITVLGLHIHASIQPTLPRCLMQVRPWAASRPACYLVGLDCYTLEISGKLDEVEEKYSEFDSSTVVQLLIRHWPA